MTTWLASWTWSIGANSRVAMVYDSERPTVVHICDHHHRSEQTAIRCAESMKKALR